MDLLTRKKGAKELILHQQFSNIIQNCEDYGFSNQEGAEVYDSLRKMGKLLNHVKTAGGMVAFQGWNCKNLPSTPYPIFPVL